MNLEKFLKYVIYGGLFLSLFIPFVVPSYLFFPFITGKNFAFRIIVELIFGAWVILALLNSSYRLRHSWVAWSVLGFVAAVGLADLFGVLPFKSFWSNFERMEGYVTLLHFAAYFVVAGTVLTRGDLWKRFFNTSVAASAVMALYGIAQLLGFATIHQGGVRLDGTFGNATYLAVYLLFHFFITLFLLFRHRGRTAVKWLYGGAMVLQLFTLYHTATRGTILGLLGGAFLTSLLIVILEKERPRLRKAATGCVIAALVVVSGFFLVRNTSFVQESPVLSRFANISLTEQTTRSRFVIWEMALQGAKERPILGWGQENFNFVFNKYYTPKLYDQEPWFDRAHNAIFDWLVVGGVVGLIAYLSIFVSLLYYLWRSRSYFSTVDKSVLTGFLGGYFFNNLFVFDNVMSYVLFAAVAAFIYGTTSRRAEASVPGRVFSRDVIKKAVTPAIVLLVVFSIYFFNAKGILASRALLKAITPNITVEDSLALFEKAISYDTYGNQEIRERLAQYAVQVSNAVRVSEENKQKVFALARDEIQKQIDKVPNDARHHYVLGGLFNAYGYYEDALKEMEVTLELSPNKQHTLSQMGFIELERGNFRGAANAFKEVFDLAPESRSALNLYAGSLLYAGEHQKSKELLLPVYGTILIPEPIFINYYVKIGDYQTVVTLWERRIFGFDSEKYSYGGVPNDAQARISLAAAYVQVGKRQDAIEQLEEAARISPSIKDQMDFYINDIKAKGGL